MHKLLNDYILVITKDDFEKYNFDKADLIKKKNFSKEKFDELNETHMICSLFDGMEDMLFLIGIYNDWHTNSDKQTIDNINKMIKKSLEGSKLKDFYSI